MSQCKKKCKLHKGKVQYKLSCFIIFYLGIEGPKSFVRQGAKRTRKFEEDIIEEETTSNRKHSGEDFEDPFEDEFEEENKVNGEDWEDVEDDKNKIIEYRDVSEEEEEKEADQEMKVDEEENIDTDKEKKQKVFLGNEELKEEEELIFDNSAYEMLHRANVQWPCLSIDVLCEDRFKKEEYSNWFPKYVNKINPNLVYNDNNEMEEEKATPNHLPTNYPFNSYVVAGSQANKDKLNCIYIMKWANLYKTLNEEDEEDENEEDAMLYYESIPHLGQVNRIRSMNGSNIVASWGHLKGKGKVSIFNLNEAIKRVDK